MCTTRAPSTLCAHYLLRWLPIMPPTALFSQVWDTMLYVALVFVATFTPLQAAFYRNFDVVGWHYANIVCETVFMLSPLVRMRRGFVHDGIYINDPLFIAAHYMHGTFLIDLVAAFPYAWLLGIRVTPEASNAPPRSAAERMIPFLRMVRIASPLTRFVVAADSGGGTHHQRLNPGVARVLQAFALLLYTSHCIGCLWWCVGELEQDGLLTPGNRTLRTNSRSIEQWGPTPWLRFTQPLLNQYMHALLWGAGMMTGYVPRDVVPHALPEVLVTMLALFFGLIINTTIISSTTSALQSISFKSARVVHKMENISQYMRHKRVPATLAGKISGFYEYQLSPYRSGEGQQELSDLPPMLAMELILHTHRDLFRDCPIFRLVPPPTALSVVEHFVPVVFIPREIVIHEGKNNNALYVINRGLVKVWCHDEQQPTKQRTLTTLTDTDFFGEQTLLKTITSTSGDNSEPVDCRANATCQCESYCDMFRLTSDDFMTVLEATRTHQDSWQGKDVACILNDAADERNMRSECHRKQSLMWAAASKEALKQTRQERFKRATAGMVLSRAGGMASNSLSSARRSKTSKSFSRKSLGKSANGSYSRAMPHTNPVVEPSASPSENSSSWESSALMTHHESVNDTALLDA